MAQKPARRHVIADIRIKRRLTQKQLAQKLGVAGSTIQKIEQGTLRLSKKLAHRMEVLGVSADHMLANEIPGERKTPVAIGWLHGKIPEFY